MERHYYRIEIYTPKGSNDKTFYYSCVNRSELHEYINEKLEEVAWEGGRMFFEHHKDAYSLYDEYLRRCGYHLFELSPEEFYQVNYAIMRI